MSEGNGPTDPALRALHESIETAMTLGDPVSRRERVHASIDGWYERAALAAAEAAPLDAAPDYVSVPIDAYRADTAAAYVKGSAEAAPLDVERLVDVMREHGIGMNRAYRIAREYAALRLPDTETER